MTAGPHILIADDHDIFRRGLRYALLDGIVDVRITEAASFDQALSALRDASDFTLASFDLQMPGMQSSQPLLAVRRLYPNLPIVVLSGHEDRRHVLAAIESGASGFVPKSLPAEDIIAAMVEVMAGRIYIPGSITLLAAAPTKDLPEPAPVPDQGSLTPRQRDVLGCLLAGRSTKEIGRDLELAEGTVKIHLAALFRMLGARNRTEAVAKAISLKLGSPRSFP